MSVRETLIKWTSKSKFSRIFACLIATILMLNLSVCAKSTKSDKIYHQLNWSNVNIEVYPQEQLHFKKGQQLTIGDLHGNALKLMYFLIYHGVFSLSESDYQQFVTIYKTKTKRLKADDLADFDSFLNRASVNRDAMLRFLGDDLCDRGNNDYFTLKIFQKLDQDNVSFGIVLSNHGNFFIETFERPDKDFGHNPYGSGRHESIVRSMLNLQKLIDQGLVEKSEVVALVEQHYLKHLRFPGVSYNLSQDEVTLYSHAPIDIAMLRELAKAMGTHFDDSQIQDFLTSLDAINEKIQALIMSGKFSAYYKKMKDDYKAKGEESPLKQVLWNRDYHILDRYHEAQGGYSVNYVHGHDSASHIFDLDTGLGKGGSRPDGPMAVYITHEG